MLLERKSRIDTKYLKIVPKTAAISQSEWERKDLTEKSREIFKQKINSLLDYEARCNYESPTDEQELQILNKHINVLFELMNSLIDHFYLLGGTSRFLRCCRLKESGALRCKMMEWYDLSKYYASEHFINWSMIYACHRIIEHDNCLAAKFKAVKTVIGELGNEWKSEEWESNVNIKQLVGKMIRYLVKDEELLIRSTIYEEFDHHGRESNEMRVDSEEYLLLSSDEQKKVWKARISSVFENKMFIANSLPNFSIVDYVDKNLAPSVNYGSLSLWRQQVSGSESTKIYFYFYYMLDREWALKELVNSFVSVKQAKKNDYQHYIVEGEEMEIVDGSMEKHRVMVEKIKYYQFQLANTSDRTSKFNRWDYFIYY